MRRPFSYWQISVGCDCRLQTRQGSVATACKVSDSHLLDLSGLSLFGAGALVSLQRHRSLPLSHLTHVWGGGGSLSLHHVPPSVVPPSLVCGVLSPSLLRQRLFLISGVWRPGGMSQNECQNEQRSEYDRGKRGIHYY